MRVRSDRQPPGHAGIAAKGACACESCEESPRFLDGLRSWDRGRFCVEHGSELQNLVERGWIRPRLTPCDFPATMLTNAKNAGVQGVSVRFFYCNPKRTWLPIGAETRTSREASSPTRGVKPDHGNCLWPMIQINHAVSINAGDTGKNKGCRK